MRILAAALGLVAVVVLGVVAFAVLNLRALIGAHHDRLLERVASVVARPVTVGDITASWWPLGIRLRDVTVGEDPAFGAAPFLAADGVVVGVRAWPLLQARIEAAGVTLERPRINLIREPGGRWNVESLGEAEKNGGDGGAKGKEHRFAFRVPLQWVVGVALSQVRDGTIAIEDRRLRVPAPLELRHVSMRATDVRLGATARMRLEATLFAAETPDVHLDLSATALGENDVEHTTFTARLQADDVDVSALSDRLGRARFASGRLRRVVVDADGTLERLHAQLELEATDRGLRVGALPIGALQPMHLVAGVTRARDSVTIDDLRATIGTLVVHATGDVALEPWRASLALRSDPAGAATVVLERGPLALSAVEGHVTLERGGATLAPLALAVDGVPVSLRGGITGVEPPVLDFRIESRPFGGTFAADVAVDATGAGRAHVEAAAIDLAAAAALVAPELVGRIEGTASGAAALTGRVGAGTVAATSLAGGGTVTVDAARLRGVNLPDVVVREIETLPFMPPLVTPAVRARYAELFGNRDTVVTSASLPFTIGRGRLATEHAVFVNPAYQITGDGWIDEARALRFHGTVLLGASVSRTLRDDVRAAKYLAVDDGRVALPFVARGRLGAVRVEPDGKRLQARGLEALFGEPGSEAPSAPADAGKRKERRPDDAIENRLIERLEKFLRP